MPKLKAKLTKNEYDALPEAKREDYRQEGEEWFLDAEGIEDVSGLKSALRKQQEENKKIKDEQRARADLYKDLDPEKAREAMKKLEELENKSLMDEGKFEELFAKRTEAMKRDHENQLTAVQKSLDGEKQRNGVLESQLSRTLINTELVRNAGDLKIKSEFVDLLQLRAEKDWTLDEHGNPVWKVNGEIKYGKDGQPATMQEYLGEIVKSRPTMLEPSSGGGANGSGPRLNGGAFVLSREEAKDPAKYRAAKAQAEKVGASFQIAQE